MTMMQADAADARLGGPQAPAGVVDCRTILQRRHDQIELSRRLPADIAGMEFLFTPSPPVYKNHDHVPITIVEEIFGRNPVTLQAHAN